MTTLPRKICARTVESKCQFLTLRPPNFTAAAPFGQPTFKNNVASSNKNK